LKKLTPGLCAAYKADAMRGLHHEDDRYMLTLYGPAAPLDAHTTADTTAGETAGAGYRAGGVPLKGFEVVEDGAAAVMTFDDVRIERATLRDVCAGLIYNASRGNRAVGVVVFQTPLSCTNGAFDIFFPQATAADGLFVID